jgi:putative phosphoribosyl transferase
MRQIEQEIMIRSGQSNLRAIMGMPKNPVGVIAFAHGSGSGRLSTRNNFVAHILQDAGFATLLADLLEEWEEADRRKVFDIDLLAERLVIITEWLKASSETSGLEIGYFGASTGAAAALQTASQQKTDVTAVVSRGGRPDLVMDYLPLVEAPTLLLVGGRDDYVIDANKRAFMALNCEKKFEIVPGATHLFEEPGALDKVAESSRDWFLKYMEVSG